MEHAHISTEAADSPATGIPAAAGAGGTLSPSGALHVREAFNRHLDEGLHPAAGVAVYLRGELAFEMYGGATLGIAGAPVRRDTLFRIFSCGKPLAAASLWALKDRGEINWDDPVARYWPEFGANGKSRVTIEQVLTHRAGLPRLPADIGWFDMGDWGRVVTSLEDAEPEYEPGERVEYHEHTFGWIVGELAGRISEMPADRFLREALSPLGLEGTWFVLPDEESGRVARVQAMPDSDLDGLAQALNDENTYSALSPGGNCFSMARDVARFYDALAAGGMAGGERWLSEETVQEVTRCWVDSVDAETGRRRRMGLGLRLAEGEFDRFGSNGAGTIFGHAGMASCESWGDPELGLSAAYLTSGLQPDEVDSRRHYEMSSAIRRAVLEPGRAVYAVRGMVADGPEPTRTVTGAAPPAGDEWSVADPEEAGMHRDRLFLAGEWQAKDGYGEPYRVLVIRGGKIVAEWNFRMDPLHRANMASASKSVYSNVLGIAVREGVIKSADDRVVEYYPEMMDVPPGSGPKEGRHAFPENEGITFRQLIGNTSGYMKPGEPPGKVFHYQTWGMNILTHAVASAYNLYKTSDPERGGGFGTLTEWRLRNRIGGNWSWHYRNAQVQPGANLPVFGYYTSYCMTTRDMAKIGLLWLRGGKWNGEQVVPGDWLAESTRVSREIMSNEPERRQVYGLGFWSNEAGTLWPDLPRDSFAASGAGKQHIWVCPSLDLVVAQSPGTYPSGGTFETPDSLRIGLYVQNLLGRIADAVL